MRSSRKKLMLTRTKWVLDKKKCFILFIIFEIIWASDFWLYLITLSLNTWRYNSTFLFSRFGTITVKRTRPTNFWGRNILWSTGSLFLPQRTRSNSLSGSFVPCSCQITNIMERSIKYMHVANDLKITSKCNRLYPCIVVVKRFPLMHNILFSDWWHCLVFISSLSELFLCCQIFPGGWAKDRADEYFVFRRNPPPWPSTRQPPSRLSFLHPSRSSDEWETEQTLNNIYCNAQAPLIPLILSTLKHTDK